MDAKGIPPSFNNAALTQATNTFKKTTGGTPPPRDSFQHSTKASSTNVKDVADMLFGQKQENIPDLSANWEKKLGKRVEGIVFSPNQKTAYIVSDNNHTGSFKENISAIDVKTGKTKWSHGVNFGLKGDALAISKSGRTLFASDVHGTLRALKCTSKEAKVKWEFQVEDYYISDPAVSPDGKNLFVFCMNKKAAWGDIYSLDANTGKVKWKSHVNSPVEFPPGFSPDGKHLLVKYGHSINSYSIDNGEHDWSTGVLDTSRYPLPMSADGSKIYSKDYDDHFIEINVTDGSTKQVVSDGEDRNSGEVVAISEQNSLLLCKDYSSNLIAIDTEKNRPRWKVNLGQNNQVAPFLSKDESEIYAATYEGDVMVIDTKSGKIKAKKNTGGSIFRAPLLTADGTTLLAADFDGNIVSLNVSRGGIEEVSETGGGKIVEMDKEVIIDGVKLPKMAHIARLDKIAKTGP